MTRFHHLILFSCLLTTHWLRAEVPAYPIYTNVTREPGILSPTQSLGSSGVALRSQLGPARAGGSFFGVAGSFPLHREADFRASGWAWGLAAGLTAAVAPPRQMSTPFVYTPSSTYWELMIGRGTVDPFSRGDSGIRGFLEFVLRNQQPQRNLELKQFERAQGLHFENNAPMLGIRGGVSNHEEGQGFVQQKAPPLSYELAAALYLPIQKGRRLVSVSGKTLWPCGSEELHCGGSAHFFYNTNASGYSTEVIDLNGVSQKRQTREVTHALSAGPTLRWLFNDRYAFHFSLEWNVSSYRDPNKKRSWSASGAPFFSTELIVSF